MGNLLEHQRVVPERRKFRIYAKGLEWVETGSAPAAGALGIASVYVNRALPFPVELPAEVAAVIPVKGETNVRIEFRGLSAHVSDLLEKLIFRHHRRLVAEARQARWIAERDALALYRPLG